MSDRTKAQVQQENDELWDKIENVHAELGDLLGVDDDENDADEGGDDEE